ncbi:MAG: ParA family protein [Ruminococcus flavefaciens]|nr:ParA family protein [Ruminococcus flavefaciens]
MVRIIAIANQKGGVGKTTTTCNLGVALAKRGKRVLLVDIDPQDGNLTASLGFDEDSFEITIAHYLQLILTDSEVENWSEGIVRHKEGVDLVPCNETLSQLVLSGAFEKNIRYANETCNTALRDFLSKVEADYDYILIDCPPTLGLITVNAFVAANSVLIPTEAAYLPAKGTQSLLNIIGMIKRSANPRLELEGILITKVDRRCAFPMQMVELFHQQYGSNIKVFADFIPYSVKFQESSAMGVSNFKHNPSGAATRIYDAVAEEVM